MKVAAFRIATNMNIGAKLDILDNLHRKILYKDSIWHFFLDPDAITLRCQPKYAERVEKFLQKNKTYESKKKNFRVGDFEPSKHEYFNIRFVGDELQEIFHSLSLMALKYPNHVIVREVLERMAHICINQLGIHDFKIEAQIYLDMAYTRATLQGKFLGLPKWLHKFIIKRLFV